MSEAEKGMAQDPSLKHVDQGRVDFAEYSPLPAKSLWSRSKFKAAAISCAMGLLAFWTVTRAIDSKTPEYKPNETQMLRLQLKQSQAQTKRLVLAQAQADFNAAYGALMDEANAVKKENKWPADTLVDPDKLQFTAPPKALPPAPIAPTPNAPSLPPATK